MCGIAGIFSSRSVSPDETLAAMAGSLHHRGPDDEGLWSDREAGIGLAHRRLSIVDLSPAGHEPMHSASGRLTVTFNGEVYNHGEIRRELERRGQAPAGGWRGHSDIETLLEAIEHWGLEQALGRAVGMFALALWDRSTRRLQLVRDRFGEKPLYYGWAGGDFIFASELKALRAHPRFSATIKREALRLFAARTYIPAPHSIYEGVFKLEPGCILSLDREAAATPLREPPSAERPGGPLQLKRYWSYRDVVREGLVDPIEDEGEALHALEAALGRSIADQAVADVPVGAFLSGGIDSSTVVALYQRHSRTPVRTFSIGFEEEAFNEAPHAAAVARQLGTVHHEQIVTAKDARDVIPLLPSIYDEPFADSSQIPTYLVSRFAKSKVTVALSGDGGDELFAGYNRHFLAPRMWDRLSRVPRPLRALTGAPLSRLPSELLARAARFAGQRQAHAGAKLRKALRVAGSARSFDDVYSSFLDEWSFEPSPVLGTGDRVDGEWDLDAGIGASDAVRMMYCDSVSYLPDDILCKVDRAAMAVSLETRVPFLDHRLAAVAARIPIGMKVRGGVGKHILRKLLYSLAPRELFERPKAGFGIPVGEWIKGPLRDWAEQLLDPRRLAIGGWWDVAAVRRRWDDHLSGRRDSTPALWAVLMFEAWLDEQGSSLAAAA